MCSCIFILACFFWNCICTVLFFGCLVFAFVRTLVCSFFSGACLVFSACIFFRSFFYLFIGARLFLFASSVRLCVVCQFFVAYVFLRCRICNRFGGSAASFRIFMSTRLFFLGACLVLSCCVLLICSVYSCLRCRIRTFFGASVLPFFVSPCLVAMFVRAHFLFRTSVLFGHCISFRLPLRTNRCIHVHSCTTFLIVLRGCIHLDTNVTETLRCEVCIFLSLFDLHAHSAIFDAAWIQPQRCGWGSHVSLETAYSHLYDVHTRRVKSFVIQGLVKVFHIFLERKLRQIAKDIRCLRLSNVNSVRHFVTWSRCI
mmetsp:Transcript_39908/g.62317  ORF Transcript_39908/g.62317 Transcript_39908/m.62317 type:complete len:313 (-) Transcript_39908:57-995(-)